MISARLRAVASLSLGLSLCAFGAAASAQPSPAAEPPAGVFQVASPAPEPPASELFVPKPTLLCGPRCLNLSVTTPSATGTGANCTTATASLTAQLNSLAATDCQNLVFMGPCGVVITTTVACTTTSSGVQVTGYARHSCKETTC